MLCSKSFVYTVSVKKQQSMQRPLFDIIYHECHSFWFVWFLYTPRTKIMQNIGIVFVKMGQYNDAITSFEHIMQEAPTFKTGFNLMLCYFALGDREKMKRGFQKLLTVDLRIDDEDKYLPHGVQYLNWLIDWWLMIYKILAKMPCFISILDI